MLPKEQIRWLTNLPDSMLSPRAVQDEKFAIKYLMAPISYEQDASLLIAVRQDLTRSLGTTQAVVFDTMRDSIDRTWGLDDTNWNEICLFRTMQDTIFRATNRIIVGSPLCHEEKYLDSLLRFTSWVGAGAVIIGHYVPWFLAPCFGYMFLIPVSIYRKKSMRFLLPVITERMQRIREDEDDMSSHGPRDLITWTILNSKESTPTEIADIILFLVSSRLFFQVSNETRVAALCIQALPLGSDNI